MNWTSLPIEAPPQPIAASGPSMVRGGVMASARKVMAAPTAVLRSVLTAAMTSNDNASFSPPLDRVPGDVLIEIATYLPCPAEILHLCLVSPQVLQHVIPVLYSHVTLRGVEQCCTTLEMLFNNPERARHVRTLSVSPDPVPLVPRSSRYALDDGYKVSAAVRRAAVNLEVLQRFQWDGEELAPNDDMWFALRVFCTRLRYVETSLGCVQPSPKSHLYDFSNLTGFALTFKSGFYAQHWALSREDPVPGYKRLWEMLINRCPNLQELSFDGVSAANPVDAHRLTRGRWPHLRKLLLGDIVLDWHSAINPNVKRPFITFLEEHKQLQEIHLLGYQPSVSAPDIIRAVHREALPRVTNFSGTLEQVQALPYKGALKALKLIEPISLRESTPLTVSGVLQELGSLKELTISFALEHGYDNGGMLRMLVAVCPNLQHLDLTCACKPSFTLVNDAFTRTIRPLCKLTSLNLRIIKSPKEESFSICGTRLARSNPRLRTFSLNFIAPTPFPPRREAPITNIQSASYELVSDHHGLPSALLVCERSRKPWYRSGGGIGLGGGGGRDDVKRYSVEMKPNGDPEKRKSGWGGLIREQTKAGEEIRCILYCVTLAVVAVGSFTLL